MRIDGKLCKEFQAFFLTKLLDVALAKNIDFLITMRAKKIGHIFDNAKDGDIHFFRHANRFFYNHGNQILRRGHNNNPVNRKRLEDGKRYVACSGRHIHEKIVDFLPLYLLPELFYRIGNHGTSPNHGIGFIFQK